MSMSGDLGDPFDSNSGDADLEVAELLSQTLQESEADGRKPETE